MVAKYQARPLQIYNLARESKTVTSSYRIARPASSKAQTFIMDWIPEDFSMLTIALLASLSATVAVACCGLVYFLGCLRKPKRIRKQTRRQMPQNNNSALTGIDAPQPQEDTDESDPSEAYSYNEEITLGSLQVNSNIFQDDQSMATTTRVVKAKFEALWEDRDLERQAPIKTSFPKSSAITENDSTYHQPDFKADASPYESKTSDCAPSDGSEDDRMRLVLPSALSATKRESPDCSVHSRGPHLSMDTSSPSRNNEDLMDSSIHSQDSNVSHHSIRSDHSQIWSAYKGDPSNSSVSSQLRKVGSVRTKNSSIKWASDDQSIRSSHSTVSAKFRSLLSQPDMNDANASQISLHVQNKSYVRSIVENKAKISREKEIDVEANDQSNGENSLEGTDITLLPLREDDEETVITIYTQYSGTKASF